MRTGAVAGRYRDEGSRVGASGDYRPGIGLRRAARRKSAPAERPARMAVVATIAAGSAAERDAGEESAGEDGQLHDRPERDEARRPEQDEAGVHPDEDGRGRRESGPGPPRRGAPAGRSSRRGP